MFENARRSQGQYRYDQYIYDWRDWVEYGLRILIKGFAISYLFYDSLRASIFLIPIYILEYKGMRKRKQEKQRREVTEQFKSMIEALSTGLSAGYSLETSFQESRNDLQFLYPQTAVIFRELDSILSGLQMNIPVEILLQDFGRRSGIDDINNFSNVVTMAKKSGGNLVQIIQKTVHSITDKWMVEEEIATMIAAKKYEERIMMIIPYAIVFYLRVANKGFLDVLYHNTAGIILMTVFLVAIYVADTWAQKIMEIHV